MLERDITKQKGILSSNLPKGFFWLRLSDIGYETRNKVGCDGLLFYGDKCWITEVKINNRKLSDSERELADLCINNNVNFIVIRFVEKYNFWSLERINDRSYFINANLGELLLNLLK